MAGALDPLSPSNWLGFETFDALTGNRLASGTFGNRTSPQPVIPSPTNIGTMASDVLSTERTTEATVGTETTTTTSTTENKVNTSLVSAWIVRGVVILLGFIFVAVGLSMFRTGQSATVVVQRAVGNG